MNSVVLTSRTCLIRITDTVLFNERTEAFGTEWSTYALFGRLAQHVNFLEIDCENYRHAHSLAQKADANT